MIKLVKIELAVTDVNFIVTVLEKYSEDVSFVAKKNFRKCKNYCRTFGQTGYGA